MLDREAKQVTRNITRPDSSVQEQTVTVNGLIVSNRSKSNQTATYSYDGLRCLNVLTRINTTPASLIDTLLPQNWEPQLSSEISR